MTPRKIGQFIAPTSDGHMLVEVWRGVYDTARDKSAVWLTRTDGSQEAKLSTNTDDEMRDGEFVVPIHNLPAPLMAAALASGLFEDTGRRVSFGFVEGAPVWCILPTTVAT